MQSISPHRVGFMQLVKDEDIEKGQVKPGREIYLSIEQGRDVQWNQGVKYELTSRDIKFIGPSNEVIARLDNDNWRDYSHCLEKKMALVGGISRVLKKSIFQLVKLQRPISPKGVASFDLENREGRAFKKVGAAPAALPPAVPPPAPPAAAPAAVVKAVPLRDHAMQGLPHNDLDPMFMKIQTSLNYDNKYERCTFKFSVEQRTPHFTINRDGVDGGPHELAETVLPLVESIINCKGKVNYKVAVGENNKLLIGAKTPDPRFVLDNHFHVLENYESDSSDSSDSKGSSDSDVD